MIDCINRCPKCGACTSVNSNGKRFCVNVGMERDHSDGCDWSDASSDQPSENMEEKTMDKSPLGIMPQAIHDQKRAISLLEAMERCVSFDRAIPVEWINELKCLYGSKTEPIRVKRAYDNARLRGVINEE